MRVRIPENITPIATALARTVQTVDAAIVVALNSETTVLRVYAISKDVYLRWGTSDQAYATSENFDEVIPAGQIIDYAVPLGGFTHVSFVGRASGGTVVAVEK